MLVEKHAHEQKCRGRRNQPGKTEGGLGLASDRWRGKKALLKLRRGVARHPRAQLHLELFRIVHKSFLSNGL